MTSACHQTAAGLSRDQRYLAWQADAMTEDVGFSHLLPLVNALLAAGNGLVPDRQTTDAFRPSQGGYYCPMTGPLRFDAIRDLPRRAEVHIDEANDNIFCRHCWTIIYGARFQPEVTPGSSAGIR
jgi:hypothetical protein